MKQYKLKEGVYIVDGLKKTSIYDCNGDKHYWVDKEVSRFFLRLASGEPMPGDEDTLAEALALNLIEETAGTTPWPDITELFCFPRHLDYAWIELTNQCNLKCTHCYNETARRLKTSLSYEDFVHVVDELARFGIKAVQLIGGEPFIIKEALLFRMLDYASESFDEFEVFFNGTLTSRRHLERIKRDYPNCKIALSLHSFIREEHEKITQVKGSYQKSVQTLRHLQELGMKFRYVGVYAAGVEVGEELDFGVPYSRDYIRLAGRGNLLHYNRKLLSEKLITLDSLKFNNLRATIQRIYSEYCFANYLYVGSDMNIYPCVMERRMCHGNLRNHALTEILDRSLINYSKENVKECKDCEFRHLCKDCRPDSISMEVDGKPWYCTYDVANGVWLDKDEFIDKLLNPQA